MDLDIGMLGDTIAVAAIYNVSRSDSILLSL